MSEGSRSPSGEGKIGDDGYFLYFCSAEVGRAAVVGVYGLIQPKSHQ